VGEQARHLRFRADHSVAGQRRRRHQLGHPFEQGLLPPSASRARVAGAVGILTLMLAHWPSRAVLASGGGHISRTLRPHTAVSFWPQAQRTRSGCRLGCSRGEDATGSPQRSHYSPRMLEDVWGPRDLPVLQALVVLAEEVGAHPLKPGAIATHLGWDEAQVQKALRDLSPEYVDLEVFPENGWAYFVSLHRPAALRATGAWPSPEVTTQRLIDALQSAAQDPDPIKRSKAKTALDALLGMSREVLVGVVTQTVGGAM